MSHGVDILDLLIAEGGRVEEIVGLMTDDTGAAVMSFPLRKDHWSKVPGHNVPPMPLRTGKSSPERAKLEAEIREAAMYAIRASTMNGTVSDFDPDAMVQNFIVGMLGYYTEDGYSPNEWANPPRKKTP